MKLDKRNACVGTLLLLIGLFLLYDSFQTDVSFASNPGELGAMDFPRILLGGWIITSFLIIFQRSEFNELIELPKVFPYIVKGALAILLYIILFSCCGFLIPTALFLLLFIWCMGYERIKFAAVFSIVVAVAFYLIFEKMLGVVFPTPFWL